MSGPTEPQTAPMLPELERALRAVANAPAEGERALYRDYLKAVLAEMDRLRAALSDAADQVAGLDAEIGGWSARAAELEQQLAAAVRRDVTGALRVIHRHGDMSDQVRREIGDLLAEAEGGAS